MGSVVAVSARSARSLIWSIGRLAPAASHQAWARRFGSASLSAVAGSVTIEALLGQRLDIGAQLLARV